MNRVRSAAFVSLLLMAVPSFADGPLYTAEFLHPADGACVRWFQDVSFRVTGPAPLRITLRDEVGHYIYDERWYGSLPPYISVGFDPKALGLDDGEHTLFLWAGDEQGNEARASLLLRVDTVPPTVRLLQPTQGQVVSGDVWIEGEVFDNYMGPGEWWLYIDGVRVKKGYGPNVEYVWSTVGVAAGSTHRIRIVAFDQCGNAAQTPNVEATIAATIRGQVELGQYYGSPMNKGFKVVLKDGDTVVETLTTTLDAQGRYSVVSHNIGTYSIMTKPSHWLQINHGPIRLDGTTDLNPRHPINGDANGDNQIDLRDINQLMYDWDTVLWRSDMDGTGLVDIYDLNLLCLNFGLFGDR
ncbi:MAG: hypothetical protein AMXMBFR61_20720 [Fimbriimonadales bacterium]